MSVAKDREYRRQEDCSNAQPLSSHSCGAWDFTDQSLVLGGENNEDSSLIVVGWKGGVVMSSICLTPFPVSCFSIVGWVLIELLEIETLGLLEKTALPA